MKKRKTRDKILDNKYNLGEIDYDEYPDWY